jgi:DeoR/GlpR family transcriptional regulator of sugar metabolism
MIKEERLNFITSELRVRNRVLLSDLAVKLAVSEDTVRRDLDQLHEEGKIKRVHGGAISNSFHLYSYKEQEIYAYQSKSVIAQKIHPLLKDGQVILMTGGTTNLEVAHLLPPGFRGTICTPSLPVAMQLSENSNIETILIGGKLLPESQIVIGSEAVNKISQINADLCFLGTGHLDPAYGFSELDWEVAHLKKAMIQSSKKVVALTIAEKLNSVQRFKVCETKSIHILVTEIDPKDSTLDAYRKLGLDVI